MNKNLENVLKDKFQNLELEDAPEGWKKLSEKLDTPSSGWSLNYYYVAASISAILIVSFIFLFTVEHKIKNPIAHKVKSDSLNNIPQKETEPINTKGAEELTEIQEKITDKAGTFQQEKESINKRHLPQKQLVYKTEITKKEIFLEDSSIVLLNENSKISVLNDEKKRQVLLNGEAFFHVKKVGNIPFEVEAGMLKIQVVGTQFNIKYHSANKIEVFVTEGRVKCFLKNDSSSLLVLNPGEKVLWDGSNLSKANNDDLNYMFWKTDMLVFEKAKISEVISTLETIFGVKILLSNPAIEDCHITFKMHHPNVTKVLDLIAILLKTTYKKENDSYIITGNGCK